MRRFLRRLRHPVVYSSGLRVIALVVGVAGSVVIARLGGAELKGVSSAYAASNALVFAFLNLDVGQIALRHSRDEKDPTAVPRVLYRVWILYLIIGAVSLLLVLWSGASVYWVLLGAVAFTLGAQGGVAVVGLRGAHLGSIGAIVQQVALIILIVVSAIFGVLDETAVKVAIVGSYIAPLCVYLPFMPKPIGKPEKRILSLRELGYLIWVGLPWQLGRFMQLALQKLDVILLTLFLGLSVAGSYSVALATAMLCTIIPAQISNHVLFQASNDRGRGLRVGRQSWATLVVGAIPAAVLAVFGGSIIILLYGPEFSTAHYPLLACLPGAVAYGVVQVQTNAVRIQGSWRPFFLVGAVSVLVLVAGILLLVSPFGAVGVGIAFSAATVVSAILGSVFYRWSAGS